ncbi:cell envelope-related function transcriptional attenuator common domain-containing protein [Paraoerskovia marina]|uniref:Cell envelope-related function transcriptional attenuator common domain-containing protein n=1 Tax=Paraoerskovia marina TaxID=545619 RepID=A0A1H1QT18_9CELL|nr:LCP family protein [Paraoerskovia marina]SDS26574.1 cell envelope-related function transcriptional attenuator common domain-containing protein [Paraoerskovia marina]
MSDDGSLPPSFTPPGGRSRPSDADKAIPVGSDRRRSRQGPTHPPTPNGIPASGTSGEPRIKRQSTRGTGEQPVTPTRRSARADTPRSGRTRASQPQARSAQQQPASYAPRSQQGQSRAAAPAATRSAPAPRTQGTGSSGIRIRKGRVTAVILVFVLILLLAWPIGLVIWANGKIQHVDALSGASDTAGTTYLLAGSDARDGGVAEDGTEGARTDSILLLQKPTSGPVSLISLPRDTYVEIPGYGAGKLNSSYSYGGPALLVQTVEGLTGLTVDHYAEIGFTGVEDVVDAIGGVELCLDYDVDDEKSGLVWEAGCHVADGETALAFSRMRYSDPKGDIGRAERQRQVIGAIADEAITPSLLWHPGRQVELITAGTDALLVDEDTGMVNLASLGLAFVNATGEEGVTGTPPIASLDYRPGGIGSTVLLDEELAPQFWTDVRDGNFEPGTTVGDDEA